MIEFLNLTIISFFFGVYRNNQADFTNFISTFPVLNSCTYPFTNKGNLGNINNVRHLIAIYIPMKS